LFDETTFDQSILKPEVQFEFNSPGKHLLIAGTGSYFEMIDATRIPAEKH